MDKIILTRLEQTCFACPSQWDGYTKSGDNVYIRYRFGYLSVDYNGRQGKNIGDVLDGLMTTSEMLEHTGLILES